MKVWPIFKKEMRLYFTSPVAYVVLFIFLVVMGYFFWQIVLYYSRVSMQAMMNPALARDLNLIDGVLRPLFSNVSVILLVSLMPLMTMRLFAEERSGGTLELLLTYPVRDGAVLAGKYLAALGLYLVLLALTLVYPAMLFAFARSSFAQSSIEWGPVFTGYLGLVLMGAAFLAVGVLASSLTGNQIVAAVITFGVLLMFWVIGWAAETASGVGREILRHLSIVEHFESFSRGVLDTKDVVYYLSFTTLALFLALRSLEAQRWKG